MPTVQKIIEKPILKRFELVSQNADLSKEVTGVGVLDYEFDDLHSSSLRLNKGEFIITSLVVARSNETIFYDILEKLISLEISGLALKNIYFKEIPQRCLDLANKYHFPLFIFDDTIFYEDIIYVIMQELTNENPNDIIIDKILWQYYSNDESYDLLNLSKQDYHIIVIKNENKSNNLFINDLKERNISYKYYDKDIIFIDSKYKLSEYIDDITKKLLDSYYLGYATLKNSLRNSLQTALDSLSIAQYQEVHYIKNFQRSYLSLLIKYYNHPDFIQFSQNILDVLESEYDLLLTLTTFINNNRDYKKTALALNIHNNTVRFRIEKIERIFKQELDNNFLISLSIALEIKRMKAEL